MTSTLYAARSFSTLPLGERERACDIPAFISIRTSSYISVGGAATSGRDANLADLWPLNADAPFVWLLSPVRYGWLDRGRVNVSTRVDNANADPHLEPLQRFGATAYRITINGVHTTWADITLGWPARSM